MKKFTAEIAERAEKKKGLLIFLDDESHFSVLCGEFFDSCYSR